MFARTGMMQVLKKYVEYDAGGCRAVVYTDDDGGSGYGNHAHVGYWYGSRAECEAVDPRCVQLHPISSETEGLDEFDLVCERRFD